MNQADFWQTIQAQSQAHWQRYQPWLGDTGAPRCHPLAIVLVGASGAGKSSLLRQLIQPLPLETTPWPVSIFTQEPPVLWTDTPGWTAENATVIATALAQADVCFWVVTQPDHPPSALAQTLKNWGRPVVKVVNLRGGEPPPAPQPQGNIIATVAVRLLPYPQPLRTEWPDGRVVWDKVTLPADLTPLKTLIPDLLTHQPAIRLVNRLRVMAVQERQWASQQGQIPIWPVLAKSLLLTLAPAGLVSFTLSLGMDLLTLVGLSRRLHLPITRHGIQRVLMALFISSGIVGGLGFGLELGMVGQGLWGGITSYGLQRIARSYLQQGITWEADGPDYLLRQIYAHLTPGSWLHAWVGYGLATDQGQA